MSDKTMRLVMILPTYLPETYGGAEQQSKRISHELAAMGVKVSILAPRLKSSTPIKESDTGVSIRRFRLISLPNLGGRHFGSFILWCFHIFRWLIQHRNNYDLIFIVHGRLHAFPGAFIGRKLRKPVVIKPGRGGAEHFDLYVVKKKRLFGRFFAKKIAKCTDAWVANSRQIVSDLGEVGIEAHKIYEVPNGINLPNGEKNTLHDGVTRFVCVGRLDPEKAIDRLIEAFSNINSDKNAELHILGDGQCRLDLERLASKLGIEHKVVFHGMVSDVRPYLESSNFYVSASMSEGMSNALLEAMSYRLPAIVSDVSGVGDLVADGESGWLYEPGNSEQLSKLLIMAESMSTEEQLVVGEAAFQKIASNCSIRSVAEKNLYIFKSLLNA